MIIIACISILYRKVTELEFSMTTLTNDYKAKETSEINVGLIQIDWLYFSGSMRSKHLCLLIWVIDYLIVCLSMLSVVGVCCLHAMHST